MFLVCFRCVFGVFLCVCFSVFLVCCSYDFGMFLVCFLCVVGVCVFGMFLICFWCVFGMCLVCF